MFKKLWRLIRKYYIKLLRSRGTPHSIALAVALGFFVGCIVPLGGQTIVVIILAIIFKTDKILAFAATWISNPYTVTVMYPIYCYIGSAIIGVNLTFKEMENELKEVMQTFSWDTLLELGSKLALSFFVGGIIFAVILGFTGYIITYKLVKKYRKKKTQKQRFAKLKNKFK